MISPLLTGSKYYIEYYVCLADTYFYATNKLGLYLSNNSFIINELEILPYVPQIVNDTKLLTSKTDWCKISGQYTAFGGEKYITIGNFFTDSLSDTVYEGGNFYLGGNRAYYYIDAVSVMLDTTVGVSEKLKVESEKFRVYPNPASDKTVLWYQLPEQCNNATIEIYDATSRIVKIISLSKESNNIEIDVSDFANGAYTYSLLINNIIFESRKIIVLK